MKIACLALASLFLSAPLAGARAAPAFPPGAEAREARLLAKYGPRTRAWIKSEARREAALAQPSQPLTANAVRQNLSALDNPRPSNTDIDELVLLVMMQTARDADQDLKTMAAQLNEINRRKEALRRARAQVEKSAAQDVRSQPRAVARPVTHQPLPRAEFDTKLAGARNSPAALNEMGEMESLRLQMAMDRLSKMMSTLSNVLKKQSDTANEITRNIK